jgi:hypothetical protein
VARLERESEPGSSLRMGPIGGSRLLARERKERRERCRLGWEERNWAGWAARGREKKEKAAVLGLAGRKGERGKRKREWAGPKEKKREKKKCI